MTVERIRLFRVPRPRAKHVWSAIFLAVVAYNSTAEDGDLLSEQVDAWLISHPVLTRVVIGVLAAHLSNLMAPEYDVISFGFTAVRKARRPRSGHPHGVVVPVGVVAQTRL